MLNERSQNKRTHNIYLHCIENSRKIQTNLLKQKVSQWLPGDGGTRGRHDNRAHGNFWGFTILIMLMV